MIDLMKIKMAARREEIKVFPEAPFKGIDIWGDLTDIMLEYRKELDRVGIAPGTLASRVMHLLNQRGWINDCECVRHLYARGELKKEDEEQCRKLGIPLK